VNQILEFISSIGIDAHDKEDVILQKRFFIYQALLMSIGGMIWGILALSLNRVWQSSVPFGYVLISTVNLIFFHSTSKFNTAKNIHTATSLILPFLLQWSLGGFMASGAVMLWALLSLAASVTYQSNRIVTLWLVMYILLTIFSGVFDSKFVEWIQPSDALPYSIIFFVLNFVIISTIVLWLVNFLVRGKNKVFQKLQKAQSQLVQSEKMATLGTLAAGVAHELNNPAAATARSAEHLRNAFTTLEKVNIQLNSVLKTEEAKKDIVSLNQLAREKSKQISTLDALIRSDRESEIEKWLEGENISDPWDLAPALVNLGLDTSHLRSLKAVFRDDSLSLVLLWLSSVFVVFTLLNEIGQGSARITEIVGALKNYSFLGQAPIQSVNLHEGIDNTLVILRSKLKKGINVTREYGKDIPHVYGYGSELNQVWTNLLHNATDALNDKGLIMIRTYRESNWAVVEIEDSGPGIPPEIQSRIFDPFFTTKDLGKGTGLGLSITYGIVTEKHKGNISLMSRPGMTRFTVKLPIKKPQSSS
jgi:signal transduction histidine kinase